MSPMPDVVFDCCVISNFGLSGSLSVLQRMFSGKACITNFVSAEISRGMQSGHRKLASIKEALEDGWLKEIALETKEEKTLLETLSISLDKVARREARLLEIKLTGTIGILTNAVNKKIIDTSATDAALKKMIALGFYSPITSICEINSSQ